MLQTEQQQAEKAVAQLAAGATAFYWGSSCCLLGGSCGLCAGATGPAQETVGYLLRT